MYSTYLINGEVSQVTQWDWGLDLMECISYSYIKLLLLSLIKTNYPKSSIIAV